MGDLSVLPELVLGGAGTGAPSCCLLTIHYVSGTTEALDNFTLA